jgi:alpha-L-arabinofuranosidase
MNRYLTIFILSFLIAACNNNNNPDNDITITIHNDVHDTLDHRLFSHFLEKPSWGGEIGPEAALKPGTHTLQDGVTEIMGEMKIPILRFPGGTDVNIQDWTTMIDNAPGRNSELERPLFVGSQGDTVTNSFGYDEMFQLAEELGSEVMLVINFGDAYFDRVELEEAVLHEAGLLAYANAEVGTNLPDGMPDWPAIREKNGRAQPYKVKYVQIANEPWVMDRDLVRMGPIDQDLKDQYFKVLEAFLEGIREIDPDIKIIADGNSEELTLPLRDKFGDQIDYLSYHIYKPWGINEVFHDDEEIPAETLSMKDIWKGWLAVPQFNSEGMSILDDDVYNMVKTTDYPIAVTEWNWNGWWGMEPEDEQPLESHFIQGIGAAGFIHAMMREGSRIPIGNQSMLVGNSWSITGIRVSPEMEFSPYPYPTGQITGFYSRHHGNEILNTTLENVPSYDQPYKLNHINPRDGISYLDVLATRSDESIYLHIINRYYDTDVEITVEVEELANSHATATHRIFEGNIDNSPCGEETLQMGCFRDVELNIERFPHTIKLPKRTVSIIEIAR